jgi:hypothetical protein
MAIDTSTVSWGKIGSPLLPQTLRDMWKDERLPAWMPGDLGLPEDATYADLGADVWSATKTVPERVLNAISILVTQRAEQIAEIRCVKDPWPLGLKPDSVPWSTRTRNALRRAGLYSSAQVNTNVTFGQFMEIEGAGVRSALDFAATLEAAMRKFDEARSTAAAVLNPLPASEGSALLEAAEEPWAAQVSGEDPRFRQPLFVIRGMSFRDYVHVLLENSDVTGKAKEVAELVERLPEVRRRASEIEQQNLEDALSDLLKRIVPAQERLKAIAERLGWNGKPPKTLARIGKQVGVTRERIRQIEFRTLRRLPESHPTFLPALDRALKSLADAAPISDKDAIALTVKCGHSKSGFHPTALIAAAAALGRDHGLEYSSVKGKHFVTTQTDNTHVRVLSSTARKLAGANGAFSVFHARRECDKLGAGMNEERIRDLLSALSDFIPLDDERDWWRASGLPKGRDRLVNLTKKMLSVASPLKVKTIRDGVFRVFKWRAASHSRFRDTLVVPPVAVLASFFEHHEDFSLDDDSVSCRTPLDYKDLLGDGERVLVEILRSSATGVLDRATLAREALGRGLGEASFGILTSFSPVLERVGMSVWKIRGVVAHPAAVEAVRQQVRDAPRERRIINYGWTGNGRIWVAVKAPHPPRSMVVGIPSGLQAFLAKRKFHAVLEDGSPCGTIASSEQSTLYGFYSFARAAALEEGDVVKMTFDLVKAAVTLEVVNEDALEE